MGHILFQYRSRPLEQDDLTFIREIILRHYDKGRSYISRALCETWSWRQPNGKLICRKRLLVAFGGARVHQFAAPPA